MANIFHKLFLLTAILPALAGVPSIQAQEVEVLDPDAPVAAEPVPEYRYQLVEPFTAYQLHSGEVKLGLINVDFGITDSMMAGTDFLADLIGAPNVKFKSLLWEQGKHSISGSVRAAYFSRDTILWGSVKDLFDELEARIFSPGLSWSYKMSKRLTVHTHWAMGFGKVKAVLSEKGKRRVWEEKHPDEDYEDRDEKKKNDKDKDDDSENQEKNQADDTPATFKQRTLMFSSIAGMTTDTFQITGEFARQGGSKVLVTSRIERVRIEDLKTSNFRFTAAQQWIWSSLQFRLGIGLQYLVITGTDLDGEEVNESGVLPATDIDFYWRF